MNERRDEQYRSAWDKPGNELIENEIREEIAKTKEQIQAETGCSSIDAHMQALIRLLIDAADPNSVQGVSDFVAT